MTLSFDSSLSHEYKKSFTPVPFTSLIKLSPISSVILHEKPDSASLSKEKLIFCYRATIDALRAHLEGDYTKFDALTSTNCCHGMSLLIHHLIVESSQIDIKEIVELLEKNHALLENNFMESPELLSSLNSYLPFSVIALTQLYILSFIKEKDLQRGGWRTAFQKLKEIAPISSKLCNRIVKDLQTYFSNHVSESYQLYAEHLHHENLINNIPVKVWSKYIQHEYVRIDKRGRKYTSCLFSMQIILAYLIKHRIKIAIINDLKCTEGEFRDRYIQLLEGDGHSNFELLDANINLNNFNKLEPVIIFGGCAYSDFLDRETLRFRMFPLLERFPSLVLACDVFYPQFPSVRDDSDFNSNPILPDEDDLKVIIENQKKMAGVSAQDPSLFCLSHIYTASLGQVIHSMQKDDRNQLPYSFIPNNGLINF